MTCVSKEYMQYINTQLDDISKLLLCGDSSNKPMYKAAYLLGCLKASVDLTLQEMEEEDDQ